ncbi:vanin-like protein 2 [Bicyclus anynana]|uniref:Vanin-like protein 2 n=1 Tax=Bicyclus anynana TaxID=110368 RepID=A0A6J1NZF0_BICAN|nr:vanin-like protein 2 [Bicyclus anynana]XP_052739027.1 vanin-like protein 2 [Bicyclus anynana]
MGGLCLFVLLCLFGFSSQKSTPSDASYVAAVVEYEVRADAAVNLQNYVKFIQDAAQQNADIVVFPEMTLTVRNHVEVPINGTLKDFPVPASHPQLYDEVLVTLSLAAKENEIYVVVNLEESVDCSTGDVVGETCPEQKLYLFNTNVVFDRSGAVIDRYRKINLFGEYTRTPALSSDLGIFETDFGVTFGHFICFDLMFQVPAIQIVQKHKITDIVFTTMWFSELPYLTAVQIQEAYAYSMDVNFLGAGANNVQVGSAGSGIYSGKAGALVSIMPGVPTTRLLVARVPKVPGQVDGTGIAPPGPIYNDPTEQDNLYLLTDSSLPDHTTRLLTPGSNNFLLHDTNLTCVFSLVMEEGTGENAPFYRAFAHDGANLYSKRDVGTVGCLVAACKTDDLKSCVYRPKEDTVKIQELEVKMIYRRQYNNTLKCNDIEYFPISIKKNMFPLEPSNFTYEEDQIQNGDYEDQLNKLNQDGRVQITNKINLPQTELISFGIWGRVFQRDGVILKNFTEDDVKRYIEIENVIYDKAKDRSFLKDDEL